MKKNITKSYDKNDVKEFLIQSNLIEDVSMAYAHEDALKAWNYIAKLETLTEKDVLKVHKILMTRFLPRIAGKFRNCDVWIGGERKPYVSEDELSKQLEEVLYFIKASIIANKSGIQEELVKEAHVMFEDLHPFEDGNGRVGRIIYNWHRLQLGLPIHIIHTGQEQYNYYQWFKQ